MTTVIFSFEGHNHLNMAFGTQSAALEQRDLILDASLVHIYSSFDVIKSISHDSSTFEKLIRVNLLGLFAHFVKSGQDVSL